MSDKKPCAELTNMDMRKKIARLLGWELVQKPSGNEKIDDNSVEVRAEASAVKHINKMEIYIDDKLKKSQDDTTTIDETFTLDVGVHTIRVRAEAENGKSGDSSITIGVKTDPKNVTPTVSPSPTP